jgi:taurine transport system substrate-binding protein
MKRLLLAGLVAVAAGSAFAQAKKEVTFAHQDMLVPFRTVMESGQIEKATGYKINWRMFSGGGDVIKAMASGDVQIGEAGSSPIAAAMSSGQEVELVWILDDIAAAEALVARNGTNIASVKDLKGKKVATPFVSTTHYQLLVAMKLEGLKGNDAQILNMRPPEIAAAWERGDIDATFVWDPVLSKVKSSGKVILTSGDVGKRGHPTFDGIVVNKKWAAANRDFVNAMVKALADGDAAYRAGQAKWTVDSAEVKAVAKWTKADAANVPAAMALYRFPTAQEQASKTWLGGGKESGAAKALRDTSNFLKEQGRVQQVKADYSAFVNPSYAQKAAGGK